MIATTSEPLTFVFKTVEDVTCYLDVYLPSQESVAARTGGRPGPLPCVLYFHGGGLSVGNRKSWFPQWIHDRAMKAGYAFLSADYRLMPPATGHDILEDVCDLFAYLARPDGINGDLAATRKTNFQLDATAVIVSGSSAGGWCAYMAARHARPKPRGVLSIYGTGGNCITDQYLSVKTKPFFMGREMLAPLDFADFLYPFPASLRPTAESALAYNPPDHPTAPGWPANPRMQLSRLYLQEAVFLDYVTGVHEPSLSKQLAGALEARGLLHAQSVEGLSEAAKVARGVISERDVRLFPQFMVDADWPPVFFLHGEKDSVVHLRESETMQRALNAVGVKNDLRVARGGDHSFDYQKGAPEMYKELFDDAFVFIGKLFGGN